MSCAIIRNEKYKLPDITPLARHNERTKESYGNQNIDVARSHLNFHLVKPKSVDYAQEFWHKKEENNLTGCIKLSGQANKQSNVACEFLITSDSAFFANRSPQQVRNFFEECVFDFLKKKIGEENIISAVVHLDESTPHLHCTYIPVVDYPVGENTERRISCKEFWKGRNSYGCLQDEFHAHCVGHGYELERGTVGSTKEHLSVERYKAETALRSAEELERDIEYYKNMMDLLEGEQFTIPAPQKYETLGEYYKRILPLQDRWRALTFELGHVKKLLDKEVKQGGAQTEKYTVLQKQYSALKRQAGQERFQNNQYYNTVIKALKLQIETQKEEYETLKAQTRGQLLAGKVRAIVRGELAPELLCEAKEKIFVAKQLLQVATSGAVLVKALEKRGIHATLGAEGLRVFLSNGAAVSAQQLDETLTPEALAQLLARNQSNYRKQKTVDKATELINKENPHKQLVKMVALENFKSSLRESLAEALTSEDAQLAQLLENIDKVKLASADKWVEVLTETSDRVDRLLERCTTINTRAPKENLKEYLERTQEQRESCMTVLEELKNQSEQARETLKDNPEAYAMLRQLALMKQEVWGLLDNEVMNQLVRELHLQQACMGMLKLFGGLLQDDGRQQGAARKNAFGGELSAQALRELRLQSEGGHRTL